MSSKTFNNTKINVEFDEDYQSRININSGENISSLFAKIRRFILDLKTVAFSGSYNDLSDTPDVVTKEYVDPIKSQAAINRTTLGTQCKNLLKNTAVTKTINGVTFTVNDDSTITANGTATSRIIFFVGTAYISQTGNYTYTGTPSGGASSTYSMNYRNSNNVYKTAETGNGITTQFEGGKTYEAVIDIRNGVSISNLTFKPMLRYADITDSTYKPYSDNVDTRLIKNKSDIALNKTTLGTQCRNLHDTLSVNWYQPGKTSVASDGTVTTTITSDSRSFTYANSEHYITLEAGNYIITANTLEFAAGSSALIRGCNSDNQSLFALSVSSAGLHKAAFSLSEKTTIGIMYKLYSQTCTIMIRDADILDDTYEPYSDNVDKRLIKTKSDIAINKSTLGYQRKNMLKNTAKTSTMSGVTFTVNDDKSVTLNGTSTAQADFYLRGAWGSTSEILQKNKYIASIGVSQSSTFNGVVMHCINNTTSIGSPSCNYPSLAVNSAITAVYISVSKGYTFSNYKLYPMIRYADILDDTYEPYQPSVQEQIIGAYFPMTQEKGLADYTDLNTITEIGNYVCYSGGSAVTMINCPTKAGGFRLIVTNLIVSSNDNSTIRYQWIIPNNLNDVLCFRRRVDISTNTFSSWYSFGGTVVS